MITKAHMGDRLGFTIARKPQVGHMIVNVIRINVRTEPISEIQTMIFARVAATELLAVFSFSRNIITRNTVNNVTISSTIADSGVNTNEKLNPNIELNIFATSAKNQRHMRCNHPICKCPSNNLIRYILAQKHKKVNAGIDFTD